MWHALSARRAVRGSAEIIHAAGPADRRPDQEHQPPAQGDEDLLSGIQGRVWEVGRGIHPGGLKSSPLPGGYRKIRGGRPEGYLA